MISYLKRIIIVNDNFSLNQLIKGSVRIIKEDKITKFYAEFIIKSQFNYENYAWILCGEREIITSSMSNACRFSKQLDSDFLFDNGASFSIVDTKTSEIICYGEYGTPLLDFNGITNYAKKNCKNNQKSNEKASRKDGEQNCSIKYDDELIATENYYEIKENELLFNQAFDFESQTQNQRPKKENEKLSFFNEESFSRCENFTYYEKVKSNLDELLKTHEKCNQLNRIINNGEFVKVCYKDNNFYYVGVIKKEDEPKYICYGVMGEYGIVPKNFDENCRFIPESPFNLTGKGYYFIFQNAITGEIVKK